MKYRTIVADPPWPHSGFYSASSGVVPAPYRTMTLDEIKALPVHELAMTRPASLPDGTRPSEGSHLFLWTTQMFLSDSYAVAHAWKFAPVSVLIWCKSPRGMGHGNATFRNTAEFVLYCKRGSPKPLTAVDRQWFTWPRGAHSAKPDAFYDLVEQVSPGPYLELFARRQRLGWDTWGNEALEHVELA